MSIEHASAAVTGRLDALMARKTLVMGVVNVTPDSFCDGGRLADPKAALDYAKKLIDDGADVLDVGGESSRPGAEPLTANDEQARVLPALDGICALGVPVSVDTYHAATARKALEMGAAIINDITALRGDPGMVEVMAKSGAPYVLMHMRGNPRTMQDDVHYDDVVSDIRRFFEERIEFALSHGMAESAIWLDPGFGFGKTVEHNLMMLRRLEEFKQFGRPLLVGTSNKGTIGTVLGLPVEERLEGTAATVAVAIWNGADAVRVHDVRAMARVAKMTDAIRRAGRSGAIPESAGGQKDT